MKKYIIVLFLFTFSTGYASAQQTNKKKATTTKKAAANKSKATANKSAANKSEANKKANHEELNPRGIYMWESGQKATPTGDEATGLGETRATTKNDANKTVTRSDSSNLKKVKPAELNQRDIHMWDNGQKATPTGDQATGLGASRASTKTDTTTRKVKPKKVEKN